MNMKTKSSKYEEPLYTRISERTAGRCEGTYTKDFILPDSYADIRKILYSSASIKPGQCSISSGRLVCDGSVLVKTLFTDDAGELRSVDFSLDFEHTCALEKCGDDIRIMYMPCVESVAAKAVNPRKIGIKVNINMNNGVWCALTPAPEMPSSFGTGDIMTVERFEKSIRNLCAVSFCESDREISEDIETERSGGVIDEVIMTDISVMLNGEEIRREGDTVTLTGSADIHIIYRDTEGKTVSKTVALPFRQSVDAPGLPENAIFNAAVYVGKISAVPAENSFGELRVIELDFEFSTIVTAFYECESVVTLDAYSTAYCTENVKTGVRISEGRPQYRHNEARSVAADCPEGTEPVCFFADAVVADGDEGPEARCRITAILRDKNGSCSTVQIDDSVRLAPGDYGEYSANVETTSLRCACENGRINALYNIAVKASGWKNSDFSYVSELALSESAESERLCQLTVSYPTAGESLWDTAKRYRVSRNALMSANSIENADETRKALIIPSVKKRR